MRVILLGAPGSGKGTVGDELQRATGFPRISTGDLLRSAVKEKTPLGLEAEGVMKAGGLVPDLIVNSLVRDRVGSFDCAEGYILDGYPRTIAQAVALRELDGGRPEIAVDLEVAEETLVARLTARRLCPDCQAVYNIVTRPPRREDVCDVCGGTLIQRSDDRPDVIRERIRVYHDQTAPLRDYYRARSVYRRVNGEGAALDVFARVTDVLDAARAGGEERRP